MTRSAHLRSDRCSVAPLLTNPVISSEENHPIWRFFLMFKQNIGFQGRCHRYNSIQFSKTVNFTLWTLRNREKQKIEKRASPCKTHVLLFIDSVYSAKQMQYRLCRQFRLLVQCCHDNAEAWTSPIRSEQHCFEINIICLIRFFFVKQRIYFPIFYLIFTLSNRLFKTSRDISTGLCSREKGLKSLSYLFFLGQV